MGIVRSMAAAVAALALVASAQPSWSDEDDCDTAVENVEDFVQIASKILENEMADITRNKPNTDSERAAVKGKFCSASGEFLGISRAFRSVIADCTRGARRQDSLVSLDESIKSLEKSIGETCN